MSRRASLLTLLLATLVAGPARAQQFTPNARSEAAAPKAPPATRADNVKEVLHGVEVLDPYRWLEDQKSPETRAWIDAQNAYTQSLLGNLPGREELKQQLTALLKVDSIGAPVERNGRYFFTKRLASQDQAVLYVRKGAQGSDEALIDPNPMSADHTTSVLLYGVAPDGTLLAYGIRQGGEDEIAIQLYDVDARKELPDRLPKGRLSPVWIRPDRRGFYYTRLTPEGDGLYYHPMGSDAAKDEEIFGKNIRRDQFLVPMLSEDGRYLLVHVAQGSAWERSEIYFKDLSGQGQFVPLVKDLPARFLGRIAVGNVVLLTNWKAPNGRILVADLTDPAPDRWREIVPESDAVIESLSLAGGKIVARVTQNASSRLRVYEPDGELRGQIVLPAIGSVVGFNSRWSSDEAFFVFESFHIPQTIYRYDVAKGSQDVWARTRVPIESDKYEIKQVFYASKDGTKVPMFLVHAKGIRLDGSNPTLLTGYGGFNLSVTPTFTTRAAGWIASGGVYALANLRGGGEFGEEWHRAGMLGKKQNVFDDFIAAAEWLTKNGYTKPAPGDPREQQRRAAGRCGAHAAARPLPSSGLWLPPARYGALPQVPHRSLLVPEYGSADDPELFKHIYAYSPYHHVKPGTKYPAVLLITGDSDTRVDPLHARKMTARLQAATSSGRPVLLHYDTKAGHSGGVPVSKQVHDLTDEFSFLLWQLGVTPAPPPAR